MNFVKFSKKNWKIGPNVNAHKICFRVRQEQAYYLIKFSNLSPGRKKDKRAQKYVNWFLEEKSIFYVVKMAF